MTTPLSEKPTAAGVLALFARADEIHARYAAAMGSPAPTFEAWTKTHGDHSSTLFARVGHLKWIESAASSSSESSATPSPAAELEAVLESLTAEEQASIAAALVDLDERSAASPPASESGGQDDLFCKGCGNPKEICRCRRKRTAKAARAQLGLKGRTLMAAAINEEFGAPDPRNVLPRETDLSHLPPRQRVAGAFNRQFGIEPEEERKTTSRASTGGAAAVFNRQFGIENQPEEERPTDFPKLAGRELAEASLSKQFGGQPSGEPATRHKVDKDCFGKARMARAFSRQFPASAHKAD